MASFALVGCPRPTAPTMGLATWRPDSVVERIPAEVSFAVVGRRLSKTVEALRALLRPFGQLEPGLAAARLDANLRRELGVSIVDLKDLEDAGFDVDGDFALFSTRRGLSLLAPVADDDRLVRFLERRTKRLTRYIRRYRGHTLTSWRISGTERGSYLRIDDYLLLHLELRPKTGDPRWARDLAWLDRLLDLSTREASLAYGGGFDWVMRSSAERRDLLAYLDPSRLNRRSKQFWHGRDRSCGAAERELARLRRVAVGFALRQKKVEARVVIEVDAQLRAALLRASAGGLILPKKLRKSAPLRGRVALSPPFLKRFAAAYRAGGCGVVGEMMREVSVAARWLASRPLFVHSRGRLAGALTRAEDRDGTTIQLEGLALALAESERARDFLRGAFQIAAGRIETIAGHTVELVTPRQPLAQTVRLLLTDGLMRLTAGEGWMERALAASQRSSGVIADLVIQPAMVGDLTVPLALISPRSPIARRRPPRGPYRMVRLISGFERLALTIGLGAEGLVAEAEYQLRR